MKRTKTTFLFVFVLMAAFTVKAFAEADQTVQKTFDKSKEVRFKLVLGECQIQPSADGKIHVNLVYSYSKGDFEPILEERNRYLLLQEKFHENNPKGYSRWTVAVPEGVELDFESATGDLTVGGMTLTMKGSTGTGDLNIEKVKGDLRLSTGTGRVDVLDSEGDFQVSSGTGRVSVRNFNGNIEASSGTGNVDAADITLKDKGEFSSGTGDAEVVFPGGGNFNLTVSSGTGDASVKMNGRPIQGFFEFTCQAKRGRIVSPEKFDKEEEFTENDTKHLLKSFTRGKDSPKVYIKTGTGRAELIR
jgi:DUF4097 and DUF4098 domain-containing protein YvlB